MQGFKLFPTLFFVFLFMQLSAFGQESFHYQAVVRDSAGIPIANQIIGVQVQIIESDITYPAVFGETHVAESNGFGVVNLNIGEGMPYLGEFSTLDWSQTSFIEVSIDVTGGNDYQLSSTSEILSVPRSLYALKAGSILGKQFGLLVTDFGAEGDGTTDDTNAFIAAIDSAASVGATILVPHGTYLISNTLTIPDGVRLRGEGSGDDPLQTPVNGSLIKYTGNDFAVEINGHQAGLENLVFVNQSGGSTTGGIHVKAENRLVESVFLSNLLLSYFSDGTALKLEAKNNGGIPYGVFKNIRIRHAKIGLHIIEDATSFVNSNRFYDGVISGGGFDYGILIEGGNNNVFHGTVIEPPSSEYGHLVISSGEIQGREIRIEGNQQESAKPLIEFAAGTKNSILNGTYGGGLTIDKGNNSIEMRSGKSIKFKNPSTNLFPNPIFSSSDGNLPSGWSLSGSGVVGNILAGELFPAHQVLELTIPAGTNCTLEPANGYLPEMGEHPMYDQVNFGFYVKTDTPNAIKTGTNAPAGWTSSQPHNGDGDWAFVGMNAFVNQNTTPKFQLRIKNTTGTQMTAYVTAPALSFGNQIPVLEPAPLTSAGGQLNGMIVPSVSFVSTPGNGFLILPKNAEYFIISNDQTIYRINESGSSRFPFGAVVTLLFDEPGTDVANSAYINLKSGFTSSSNSSLTLMSKGNGRWREVNRNN